MKNSITSKDVQIALMKYFDNIDNIDNEESVLPEESYEDIYEKAYKNSNIKPEDETFPFFLP